MSDPQETSAETQDTAQDAAPAEIVRKKPAGEPIDAADMAGIARVVVARAKDGDMKAAEVARKTWRWPQQAVHIDLPPVTDAASLAEAHGAVIATAAAGKLTTRQALDFSTMLTTTVAASSQARELPMSGGPALTARADPVATSTNTT